MPLEKETLNVVDHHIVYHVCSHNDETEYFSFVTSYIQRRNVKCKKIIAFSQTSFS